MSRSQTGIRRGNDIQAIIPVDRPKTKSTCLGILLPSNESLAVDAVWTSLYWIKACHQHQQM